MWLTFLSVGQLICASFRVYTPDAVFSGAITTVHYAGDVYWKLSSDAKASFTAHELN